MLWEHNTGINPYNTEGRPPIGRWENVRKEGDKLLGRPVFDMDDIFARMIAGKVKNNFIRSASIYIDVIDLSDDPVLKLEDQTLGTIIDSELREVSICGMGGNLNAVRLRANPELNSALALGALAAAHSQGITEFEYLWKNGGLEKLKASNPARYNLLLAEFKGSRKVAS